jgi:two-component system chemotaxis response regulator CheB
MAEPRVKLLIVDDSAVFRGFWARLLAQTDVEVVTAVSNGKEAVAAVTRNSEIEMVLLDIEMAEMDGLTAIPLLLAARPKIKIIMASSLTAEGSRAAVDALTRGAHDFVQKPSSLQAGESLQKLQVELIQKINNLKSVNSNPLLVSARPVLSQSVAPLLRRPQCILIGSSTGGPQALRTVLSLLPARVSAPIVIVQHMPPRFTTMLAEQLQKESGRQCVEVQSRCALENGLIYIAPGDYHLVMLREGTRLYLNLNQEAAENFCRPAVDVLFRSAAKVLTKSTLAIVLTGMGEDGRKGCEALKSIGATIVAQDEASSVVWGMPGAVARANLADHVLPLSEISPLMQEMYR